MSLEERKEERGMVGAMLVGALKTSVEGGLRQMSVDGRAVIVKGSLVGDMMLFVWIVGDDFNMNRECGRFYIDGMI